MLERLPERYPVSDRRVPHDSCAGQRIGATDAAARLVAVFLAARNRAKVTAFDGFLCTGYCEPADRGYGDRLLLGSRAHGGSRGRRGRVFRGGCRARARRDEQRRLRVRRQLSARRRIRSKHCAAWQIARLPHSLRRTAIGLFEAAFDDIEGAPPHIGHVALTQPRSERGGLAVCLCTDCCWWLLKQDRHWMHGCIVKRPCQVRRLRQQRPLHRQHEQRHQRNGWIGRGFRCRSFAPHAVPAPWLQDWFIGYCQIAPSAIRNQPGLGLLTALFFFVEVVVLPAVAAVAGGMGAAMFPDTPDCGFWLARSRAHSESKRQQHSW